MEYMRLRPAMHPFVKVVGGFLVVLIVASLALWLFSAGLQIVVEILSPLLAIASLAWLAQRYYVHLSNLYIVSDTELVEVSGLFVKEEYHVPVGNIQDYTVIRTPMIVLLGLTNIGIQTGRGDKGYEIVMLDIHEKDRATLTQLLEKLIRPTGGKSVPLPVTSAPPDAASSSG